MKEGQPPPPPPRPLTLWEQRSLEAWENLRCLGKRFTRAEQIEVIDTRLVEIQQAHARAQDEELREA